MGRAPISRLRRGADPPDSGTSVTVAQDEGDLFPTPPFAYLAWPNQTLPTPTNSEEGFVTRVEGDVLTLQRGTPPIDLNGGLMFAAVRAVPVSLRGDDVTLEHDFGSDDPPYRLTLQTPGGQIGSYGEAAGTVPGIVDDGDGFVHFNFETTESGFWAARWESASVRLPDELFFVEFDEIKD